VAEDVVEAMAEAVMMVAVVVAQAEDVVVAVVHNSSRQPLQALTNNKEPRTRNQEPLMEALVLGSRF
jgi:hypothetical protein